MVIKLNSFYIVVSNVAKEYPTQAGVYTVLDGVELQVNEGEFVCIIGHSERRQYFGETDETVNLRVISAQKQGLIPIICVGESKAQRDAGETEKVIIKQIQG